MSRSPHQQRSGLAPATASDDQDGELSRRSMLAGTIATTTVAAVGPIGSSAQAATVDPNSKPDMMAFLVLSTALTGIHVDNLAPEVTVNKNDVLKSDPGVDPINVKNDYFKWIHASDAAMFEKLLQIANAHSTSAPDIIEKVNENDDTKYLARSIVLLWYLGSWYKPQDLKSFSAPGALRQPIPSQVVSAKAYTQGRVWQIAQAHPMGYSNLEFGYWSRDPVDPNDKSSPFGFITATIP
jgi:hypothetical protein